MTATAFVAAKKSFEQQIKDLKAYKEKYGHVNVKKSEDRSLYDFCSQRRHIKKIMDTFE